MTEMMRRKGGAAALLIATVMPWGPGVYAGEYTSMTVNVSGTIMEGSCKVNNDGAISVEFGTVQSGNLQAASATVPVTIDCTGSVPANGVLLAINGDKTSFSSQALKTSVDGLGITLRPPSTAQMSSKINLNTNYNVKMLGMPSVTGTINLTAGLVSDGSTTLAGGDFTAAATLVLTML